VSTFKSNLAKSLGIKQSFIIILNVKSGSVIVDFEIKPTEDDQSFISQGGLEALKTKLEIQILTQTLWLGAPLLNATITGKSVNIREPNATFEAPTGWNASGTEVWVNAPPAPTIIDVLAPTLARVPPTQAPST
jgi:hypothetical protein